jgi:hypothetical protein
MADARETARALVEAWNDATMIDDPDMDDAGEGYPRLIDAIAAAIEGEREACAKIADAEVTGANSVLAIADLKPQARREAEAWLAPAKAIAARIRFRARTGGTDAK